ncbi:MAG: hypothetical protein IEMM0008_1385 [bacterium]|nr:MAG: hypothetical protein IEMM0008_1385 [bacterium]
MKKSGYDQIIKENLKGVVDVLIIKVLGIEMKRNVMLETKLQITDEREADFILEIDPLEGKVFILHLEFQSTNDVNMIYRMLRYYLYITETYQLPVKQYVIYIGRNKLKMTHAIKSENLTFHYELVDMKNISYQPFLESENPEEIIMSILCDFENKGARVVIHEILSKLKQRIKEETRFSKYIRQLEVLSQLRDLQETILEEESKMAIIYDIEEDIRFKQGKIEGKVEGKVEGKAEEKLRIIKKMSQQGLDLTLIAKVTGLSEKEIIIIIDDEVK